MAMEYYPSRKVRKIYRPVVIVLILFAILIAILSAVMRTPVLDAAVYRSKVIMTQQLQETVIEALEDSVSYDDLVEISKDADGKISSVRIDSARISRLQAAMTKDLNERLSRRDIEKASVPIGTLTGFWLFSGRGPCISFYTAPISSVHSEINHRFESAGINQTRHSVELELSVDAKTLILGEETPFNVSTRVVLSDTIIVGVTPDFFAGTASGNK